MTVEIRDPRFKDVVGESANIECLGAGYLFTEGTVLHPEEKHLTFSDIGSLNRVVHMWVYRDYEDRVKRRAALLGDPSWKTYMAKALPLFVKMENMSLRPAPFWRCAMDLKGKTAIVTGAAQGIGFSIAQAFVREGARVMILDVNEKRGTLSTEELAAKGGEVGFQCADVAREDEVANAVEKTIERFGGIDICVNNAGVTHRCDLLEFPLEAFDRVMAINVRGPFILSQMVARHMVKTGRRGSIVNITSVNAIVCLPDNLAYVTSKGGLTQLTRALSVALAPKGIRVNAVGPGSTNTELQRSGMSRNETLRRMVLSRTPLGRLGEPEEVAEAVVFLASDKASYITGQCLYVEGGRLSLNFTMNPSGD